MSKEKTILVCDECGGKSIQVKAWVDANTNEFIDDAADGDEDYWCDDCQDSTCFESEEDYAAKGEE